MRAQAEFKRIVRKGKVRQASDLIPRGGLPTFVVSQEAFECERARTQQVGRIFVKAPDPALRIRFDLADYFEIATLVETLFDLLTRELINRIELR